MIAGGVVPMFSYGLWLSRDVMTMSAAFTLPPIVGSMVESTGLLSTSTSKVRFYYDAIRVLSYKKNKHILKVKHY